MRIVYKIALTILLSAAAGHLSAQRLTREEYILRYKHLAAETMENYGIPASIVMAQALLESDNGNSRLARQANNHFGIKCGSSWPGEIISHDDDAANECFRVYASTEDSFLDHGKFIDGSARYDRLFSLAEDDYEAWAHGLRECGYATNPNYGPMLIRIIEDNKLYLLDQGGEVSYADIRSELRPVETAAPTARIDVDDYTVTLDRASGREIRYNNAVAFVIALPGDSFASIARDFRINRNRLLKFNDLTEAFALRPGDRLYIARKNRRSQDGPAVHTVQAGETLHSLSQAYGIRLKTLARLNRLTPETALGEGQQLRLPVF